MPRGNANLLGATVLTAPTPLCNITCVLQDACNTHVMRIGAILVVFHFWFVSIVFCSVLFRFEFYDSSDCRHEEKYLNLVKSQHHLADHCPRPDILNHICDGPPKHNQARRRLTTQTTIRHAGGEPPTHNQRSWQRTTQPQSSTLATNYPNTIMQSQRWGRGCGCMSDAMK